VEGPLDVGSAPPPGGVLRYCRGARMASPDYLDTRLAKALSHPLRPRILQVLTARGEASPVQIAAELGESLGVVSYHMRILLRQDCVELVRTEPRRGAIEHYYKAVVAPFIDDDQWTQLPLALRRQLTGNTIGQVLQAAAIAARDGGFDMAGAHVDRVPLNLDREGWDALSALLVETLSRAAEIQQRSEQRAGDAERSELAILHYAVRHSADT
jgi:DNA-binding transcriptional ArsR family regulator